MKYSFTSFNGLKPRIKPATTAESRMPVPVADRRFSVKIAASEWASATTGGTLKTRLCRCGTCIFQIHSESSHVRTCGVPHKNTKIDRTSHGSHARKTAPLEWLWRGWTGALVSSPSLPVDVQMRRGCQKRRNAASAAMEQMAAITSTSHGPWKLDTTYCGTANETPATSSAGQTSIMPLRPAKAQMSQNGTMA